MQIEFKTTTKNKKTFVVYTKDGVEISRQETTNPLGYISAALDRIERDPHLVFSVICTVNALEILSNN